MSQQWRKTVLRARLSVRPMRSSFRHELWLSLVRMSIGQILTMRIFLFSQCLDISVRRAAHRAHIRRQKHICFVVFWGEQEICKPPWGSVTAAFSQKGRQNHLFAGIDASPLVKRETQHETYAPHPSRKRERWRSICGSASRRYVWRKA